jgi:transposase-like protein
MTEDRLVLAELLEKAGDGDFLRAVADAVLQLLMEADVEGMIGAGRYERSGERMTWRNGYRDRPAMRSISFSPRQDRPFEETVTIQEFCTGSGTLGISRV